MDTLTRSYDLPASAPAAEREWHALEHDQEMRGSLRARFEAVDARRSRISISTAEQPDGERRIQLAISRLRGALAPGQASPFPLPE